MLRADGALVRRVAPALTLALLVAGCGGPADDAPPPPAETASPAAASPTAAAVPSATTPAPAAAAMPVGDVARGQSAFNQCRACHAAEPGRNGIGPSLAGVVGREAGTVAGYSYSPANQNSHLNWDRATLFAYLAEPSALVPGTKMTFVMRDAQQRADVIAYLETLR